MKNSDRKEREILAKAIGEDSNTRGKERDMSSNTREAGKKEVMGKDQETKAIKDRGKGVTREDMVREEDTNGAKTGP